MITPVLRKALWPSAIAWLLAISSACSAFGQPPSSEMGEMGLYPVTPSPWPAPTTPFLESVPESASTPVLTEPISTASAIPAELPEPEVWDPHPVQPLGYVAKAANEFMQAPSHGIVLGSIKVVPYGILWTDMIYASSRTYPSMFVLWIESEQTHGESSFVIDARRSRVGVNVTGPEVDVLGGLTGGGKVEVDFLGGFTTENTTDARLRHVYWEAKNEEWRFLTGQTWDLVSPLLPSTVNFSVGWCTGNIGFRRTQMRVERYLHTAEGTRLTLQCALAQNIVPDLASGSFSDGVYRETGGWPEIQARSAVTFGGNETRDAITLGVSGHIGETGFDFSRASPGPYHFPSDDDARFPTWSINSDWNVPMTQRLGAHGEFFYGTNLSQLLGGVGQGICPCTREPIRAAGGWAEIWYDLTPCARMHFGAGIDDPNDHDSLVGRTYNRSIYANVFVQITENLRTGLECSVWRTGYHNLTLNEPDPADRLPGPTQPGRATVIDWTVQYKF